MARTRDTDACPGALQTHRAADGDLARVRLPAGMLTAEQMEAIATAALDLAAPALELTSRGNVQIRGIRDVAELGRRLTEAGLLPSPDREKIRNIVASPLSGRQGGLLDVRAMVHALDDALQQDPTLTVSTTVAATSPASAPTSLCAPSTGTPWLSYCPVPTRGSACLPVTLSRLCWPSRADSSQCGERPGGSRN